MKNKPYIVAVDDMYYNLEVLSNIFSTIDAELVCIESGREALEHIKMRTPDLILLDIVMPEMSGYEVCEVLKKDTSTSNIPIIFLSGLEEVESKIKAFEMGGVDYIVKPFNTLEVKARVKTHLKLHRMLKEVDNLLRESFHEIYTPLGLIESSLSLLELKDKSNEHLQNIKASVRSLHSIYEDMYYAIKKEVKSYPPEWINLELFLRARLKLFHPQMQYRKLNFEFICNVESPMIKINNTELERLVDNIMSNAIKYAIQKSTIIVTITLSNKRIKLCISNHSKKIKNPKKLFHALYREDNSTMGLGIGLSIVQKICQKHDIGIHVDSHESITKFILSYKERP